jgi:hypothetical protein
VQLVLHKEEEDEWKAVINFYDEDHIRVFSRRFVASLASERAAKAWATHCANQVLKDWRNVINKAQVSMRIH